MVELSAHHIAPQAGGFEPQRLNNFTVEIYGLPGTEILELALAQGFTPTSTSGVPTVAFHAESRKFAGRSAFGNGSIVYNDYVDIPIASALEAWRRLLYDPTTGRVSAPAGKVLGDSG